jgi:8-oxo-dGTP pyrophosphatase MutT (NUDIX family)
MKQLLFLTGRKKIGKTTAIRRFLEQEGLRPEGFRTVLASGVIPGVRTAHLLSADAKEEPSRTNYLFRCGKPGACSAAEADRPEQIRERFIRLGCGALDRIAGSSPADRKEAHREEADTEETARYSGLPGGSRRLVLMDELGPHEADVPEFQASVKRVLTCGLPVLGVLQQADAPFLQEIVRMRETELVPVTEENRNALPRRLGDWYHALEKEAGNREEQNSYGAVVFSEDGARVLMIQGRKSWSFPKGRRFFGESEKDAAVREILEETGVRARVDTEFAETVPSIYGPVPRKVTFFAGTAGRTETPLIPLEVEDAAWVPLEEAAERIRIPEDRDVLLRAIAYVSRRNS